MLAAPAAIAQAPEGFSRGVSVSPTAISVQAIPGSRTVAAFDLSNLGSQGSENYTIEVLDLGQDESGTIVPALRGRGARSCADWIVVPSEVKISAGSSSSVEMSIWCPVVASGAYYSLLRVTTAPTIAGEEDMTVAVRPSIGVTLEVKTSRPAPSHLEPKALLYLPASGERKPALLLKVKNTGVWKEPVEGDILIYDRPGQFPVRASTPYEDSGNPFEVYPGMTLDLRCPLRRTLEQGTHRVSVRLSLNEKRQARRNFDLEVSGTGIVAARAGAKSELDIDLSVESELIEVSVPPGGRRIVPIKMRNDGERVIRVSAQATRARMEPSGMLTYPGEDQDEAMDWLTVSQENFELEPKRSATVRAQVTVPNEGVSRLPSIGVVRLRAETLAGQINDEWASGGEFPVVIVVQDPKASKAALEIASLRLVRPSSGQNPTAAVLLVKNTGDEVARVFGGILFKRTNGQEIARMEIGSFQPELILPRSEREFRMPLGPLDAGKFLVQAELGILGSQASKQSAQIAFESVTTTSFELR